MNDGKEVGIHANGEGRNEAARKNNDAKRQVQKIELCVPALGCDPT